MHVAACKALKGANATAITSISTHPAVLAYRQVANRRRNRSKPKSIVEPVGASSERFTIASAKLKRIRDETRATDKMMIDAHDLQPELGGFAAPILIEYIDASICLSIKNARSAVADWHAIGQNQESHRAFQRISEFFTQTEYGNRHASADVRKEYLVGAGEVEMQCLSMSYGERRNPEVDESQALSCRYFFDEGDRTLYLCLRVSSDSAHALVASRQARCSHNIS